MFKAKNHRFVKIVSVFVAEFIAMLSVNWFSHNVFPVPHNILSYLLCGGILAAIVVTGYDMAHARRKSRAKKELQALTNAVYKIYATHHK